MEQDPSGLTEKCLTSVAFGKVLSLLQQEFDMTCFLLYIVFEKHDFDLHCLAAAVGGVFMNKTKKEVLHEFYFSKRV
jgi:hypothetical protein